jgi:predicted RNase H-like HicB family nuclease
MRIGINIVRQPRLNLFTRPDLDLVGMKLPQSIDWGFLSGCGSIDWDRRPRLCLGVLTVNRRLQAVNIEIDREEDGRWIAEVPDLPGVMVYGQSQEEAIAKVEALALRVLADQLEHGENIPDLREVFAVPA